jgi:uncharacterized protein YodC (DUF2158 family)
MAKFKPGDRVRPKFGGPEMMIDRCDERYGVICSFWNTKKNRQEQTAFMEETLKLVGPASGADSATLLQRLEALEGRVKQLEDGQRAETATCWYGS